MILSLWLACIVSARSVRRQTFTNTELKPKLAMIQRMATLIQNVSLEPPYIT